jgi:hypothetical protein
MKRNAVNKKEYKDKNTHRRHINIVINLVEGHGERFKWKNHPFPWSISGS